MNGAARPTEPLSVLIVEDNPADADLVREYLRSADGSAFGVEIDHVERLRDALVRLGRGAVDVVLLDLSLPDASGLEALRQVRAATPSVPIVVLTGADEATGLAAMKEGAQDYLPKGDVHPDRLARSLRYAMQRQQFLEHERALAQERAARLVAEEAVGARDEFLAVAGHELTTPLAALQLEIALLERTAREQGDDPDCAKCAERLGRATRQLARLKRLVGSVFDVSRILGGRQAMTRESVDLVLVARRVIQELASSATAAGCSVAIDAPEPVAGQWDPTSIEQIVANLLSNAIKYGARSPVEISVRRDGDTAVLTVEDHGIGIAPENVARIFERFERAVPARRYGGLGLGLFIVRHIAVAHCGTIEVESRPGAGSTFTVRLPLESPEAPYTV